METFEKTEVPEGGIDLELNLGYRILIHMVYNLHMVQSRDLKRDLPYMCFIRKMMEHGKFWKELLRSCDSMEQQVTM